MVVDFQTQPTGKRTFSNSAQTEANMKDFGKYLQAKYEYISKMDMLTQEKETRQRYNLTVGEATKVWNNIYG